MGRHGRPVALELLHVTLQQLRYFVALCEEASFTRAARRCGVSQPSLSAAIRVLEDELGGELYSRNPRGGPTKLGNALYPLIRSAMAKLDMATQVAAGQSVSNVQQEDRRRHPSVRLSEAACRLGGATHRY